MQEPISIRQFDRTLTTTGHWSGPVVMAFEHAAVARSEDGHLVTLLHPRKQLVPNGLVFPWEPKGPRLGDRVVICGRSLFLSDGAGEQHAYTFEGDGASLQLPLPTTRPLLRTAWTQISGLLLPPRTRAFLGEPNLAPQGVERAVARVAGRRLHVLTSVLTSEECSAGRLGEEAEGLLGLGEGMTPTGDDLIVGLLAISRYSAQAGWLPRGRYACLVEAAEGLDRSVTTPVAAEMLRLALEGRFPEALGRFISGLGGSESAELSLAERARDLASLGGSSGTEMLAAVVGLCRDLSRTENDKSS